MYIEEWQANIYVKVDGKKVGEKWATAAGGALTTQDAKTRAGGMGAEVSCGGPGTRSDLTCTTQITDIIAANHKKHENMINHPCEVQITWLDLITKKPIPKSTFTRVGRVKEFSEPGANHTSNALGMYQFIMSCHETAA